MPTKKKSSKPAKRSTEGLHETEARFRTMFDTAAVGIGMMSLDRKLLDANPALCRMFGMSREELIGQTPVVVTYPEDYPQSTQQFADLLSGKDESYWDERRYKRKNGEVFWASATMSVVRDDKGKPLYIIGMLVDIDEQKKALTGLQESEARLRAIYENVSIGIALVSLDGRPLAVNPAILDMTGYTEQELLSMSGLELSHPEGHAAAEGPMRELIEGKRDTFEVESRFVRKDGQTIWVRQTISSVRGQDGNPAYLVVMVANIDEQKHILKELGESEARFRAMYDNAAVGMAMMSLDRKIIGINQTAAQMTGYTLQELFNTDPSRLSHPEDVQIGMDQFREMVAGKTPGLQMEKRFIRKNGDMFWGRVTYSVVPDRQGKPEYLVGIIEDVTNEIVSREKLASQEAENRRTLEDRVEERTYELAEANLRLMDEIEQRKRAEEALATKAADDAVTAERTRLARELHDAVTQTLFASSLIAEVLPDLWEMDEGEAKKSTEELRQLTRGALAEMRTLLLELRPAALTQSKLGDLIRQLCEAFIGRSRLPIDLTVEGDRSLPPEVQVAYYRIAQESLNNVFKYARATKVDVSLFMSPAGAHLNICDNGVGFDMSSMKTNSLGIRIMRERAEAIGAHLSVSSETGHGACVEVEWYEQPDMKLSVFKRDNHRSLQ